MHVYVEGLNQVFNQKPLHTLVMLGHEILVMA